MALAKCSSGTIFGTPSASWIVGQLAATISESSGVMKSEIRTHCAGGEVEWWCWNREY